MYLVELNALLTCLNLQCYEALDAAVVFAQNQRHAEVEIEHLLHQLLESDDNDLAHLFAGLGVSLSSVRRSLRTSLTQKAQGVEERPELSPYLAALIQDAWVLASLQYQAPKLRSGYLLLPLLQQPTRYRAERQPGIVELTQLINVNTLRARLPELTAASKEQPSAAAVPAGTAARDQDSALHRFTTDITEDARIGRIDEVTGRDAEIDQLINILSRRRKNNPIIVGEAGVGKTALVEGLALRIVRGEVHGWLRDVSIRGLDLGLLQAGAGLRGEFETRLTSLIREIKTSAQPIILFIDEAHMIIGTGNSSGAGDAANLLKPALARGELRTIAATTWSEYKKYFDKDPALRRRFQMVRVDEPSRSTAISMLAQLLPRYESTHGVHIRYDALEAAVEMSSRYLSSRQLPDKAVDLIDRCASAVKLRQSSRPIELDRMQRRLDVLRREQQARQRDCRLSGLDAAADKRLGELNVAIEELVKEQAALKARYDREQELVKDVQRLRSDLEAGVGGTAAVRERLQEALTALKQHQADGALLPLEVDPEAVAAVVAEETSIPVGRLMSSDLTKLERLEQHLGQRIKGQSEALKTIANRIRSARLELQDARRPVGVFLLVGPSGTGKTETALAVADLLYGGEQFMTTINMSEYLEEHSVSRLIGAPPGYVGYEEGGVLSDSVRQRPYSVVLLDEVEKAKRPVLNLFYQIFDRGRLNDGQGRTVDFSNTVIFMTSNLGHELTMLSAKGGAERPPLDELRQQLMDKVLRPYFSPALLARMTVLPYFPLGKDVIEQIMRMKLDQVAARIAQRYRTNLSIAPAVNERLLAMCHDVDSGARVLDHLIREDLVPSLTRFIMSRLGQELPGTLHLSLTDGGDWAVSAG